MYSVIDVFADMGRPKHSVPTLRHHAHSGQAFVLFNGVTIYLGHAGSAEAAAAYQSILANITKSGQAVILPVENRPKLTVGEIVNEYLSSLPKNYPATSGEPKMINLAMRWLLRPEFAAGQAESFTPAKFLELRQAWVDAGKSILTINKWHNYILNLFRWAAMTDRLPASVWHSLQTVPKLKPGRSPAKSAKKVDPVPIADVEAVKAVVSDVIRDLIDLQIFTGMRSGEVLSMTTRQIVDNVYRPDKHKNKWRGHKREIHLGPQARAIIARRSAGLSPDDRLFKMRVDSYTTTIDRACKRAGVTHWHPHQLRHLAGSMVRDKYGLDAAQAFLGHATAKTSEIYAKVKTDLSRQAAEEIG
jgi:integrase